MILWESDLDVPGFLARKVDDLSLLVESLGIGRASPEVRQKPVLIAPVLDEIEGISDDTYLRFEFALKELGQHCEVRRTHLSLAESVSTRKIVAAKALAELVERWQLDLYSLSDELRAILMFARNIPASYLEEQRERMKEIRDYTNALVGSGSSTAPIAILTPALPGHPPDLNHARAGIEHPGLEMSRFLALANISGLPALTFPTRPRSSPGLNQFQLVGSTGSERQLLEIATYINGVLEIDPEREEEQDQ
jgi:Asp-tRNA(Asn)/Glu-tRNA(Gln) amidotransferase A subunit family amidase